MKTQMDLKVENLVGIEQIVSTVVCDPTESMDACLHIFEIANGLGSDPHPDTPV